MQKNAAIFIAGHRGMVGSAILRRLQSLGYHHLLTKTHQELDLTNQAAVADFFANEKPEYVFIAAAKVGGIHANNTYRAEFIRDNVAIQTHIIHHAWKNGVKRLLFLGSSCIYPRQCPQPIKEEYLLTGPLEMTNRPYAIAKISGIEMCWSYNRQYGTQFITAMPTNLYGANDHYDLNNAHVLPALIRKTHEAKENNTALTVWGTGSPRREFLLSDDLADACVYLMNLPKNQYEKLLSDQFAPIVNVGCGQDISIKELVAIINDVIGFQGRIEWDTSKPDGTPRKILDVSLMNQLGWRAATELKQGIRFAYEDFRHCQLASLS